MRRMTVSTIATMLLCGAAVGQQPEGWPSEVEFPSGALRYEPAKHVQRLFNFTQIGRVPRSEQEERWRVPGGMAGVKGWRSELYRAGFYAQDWVGDKAVPNGGFVRQNNGGGWFTTNIPTTQNNLAWLRRYADGSIRIDRLINAETGKDFEIRRWVVIDGKQHFDTLYRDKAQRPEGYAGLTVTCASCHSRAGEAVYDGAAIPGGAGGLSEPFEALER